MMPTQSASATGAGVPSDWNTIQWNDRRQQRQQGPGVEVAAGLVDRQLPRPQHPLLAGRGQPAADGPPQLRPVGDEVEREQQHRQQLQQAAERGDRQLHALSCWSRMNSCTGPSGSLKSSTISAASMLVPNVSLIVSTVSVMYVSEF